MRRSKVRIVSLVVGCVGMLLLIAFALAQPATDEKGVARLALSRPSGFYDEPFYLELSCDGGTIYYTLDSSDPDENAIPYTEPILIEDATQHENVYCMNRDVALDLREELLADNGFKLRFNYKLPDFPVDKATVVRAVCIGPDGNRGDTVDAVYFVGYGEKTGYEGLNFLTITTDPENLFDYEKGIYVLGKLFDDALVDGKIDLDPAKKYSFLPANYWGKGKDWEREASLSFFDTNGKLMYSGKCGIRIQGHGTRAMLPKNLNLFARGKYGESAFPCQALFGIDCELKKLNLTMGSDSINSMLHDYLVNALCADLNIATREYEPYAMFLDGEYWGLYWLTPRYKSDYLSQKYQVYSDNIVAYYTYDIRSSANKKYSDNLTTTRQGRVEIGRDEDEQLYRNLHDFICENDMSDPAMYEKACAMIDIDSCVDYYATEIFIANTDWPVYNTALWRSREASPGKYSDGRWRWLLFDVNISMFVSYIENDTVLRTINRDGMFASLMDNEDFSARFYARLVDLARNNFAPDRVNRFIDDYEQMMAGPMTKAFMRFYNGERTEAVFVDACEKIREFCLGRSAYILSVYGDDNG